MSRRPPRDQRRALSPWWERYPDVAAEQSTQIATLRGRQVVRGGWREEPWLSERPASVDNPVVRVVRAIVRPRVAGASPGRRHMLVDVRYPPAFPFEPPQVVPVDPAYRGQPHQDAVTGALCWQLEELEPWLPAMGIDEALHGATQWLEGLLAGRWETAPPVTELERYFRESLGAMRMLLLPPDSAPPATGRWGQLQIETVLGRPGRAGIGVLAGRWERHHTGADTGPARAVRDQCWTAIRSPGPHRAVDGLWVRLEKEPKPFATVDDLAGVLETYAEGMSWAVFHERLARVAGRSLRDLGWAPVGLYYPTKASDRPDDGKADGPQRSEWVFFAIQAAAAAPGRGGIRRTARSVVLRQPLAVIPSHDVQPAADHRRQGDLSSPATLAEAHVMVVGVGALGSTIARSLAAAGVGRFTLVDRDVMKPGNVIRHELRFADLARAKTTALRQVLLETNPFVQVDEIQGGSRQADQALERQLLDPTRRPTLVIGTTAVKAVEAQLDMLAARTGLHVLHAWVAARAQLLRAFLYRPGRTPCTLCVECHRIATGAGSSSAYIADPDVADTSFYEKSCAAPTHVGTGNANALAAHVVVEMALLALAPEGLPDHEAHWLFAGNHIRTVAPAYPLGPLSRTMLDLAPHPECHLCAPDGMLSHVRRPDGTGAVINPDAA